MDFYTVSCCEISFKNVWSLLLPPAIALITSVSWAVGVGPAVQRLRVCLAREQQLDVVAVPLTGREVQRAVPVASAGEVHLATQRARKHMTWSSAKLKF